MPKHSLLAGCLSAWSLCGLSAVAQESVLPEGTPIRLKIMRTLSSASATEGNKIDFQTIDDVNVGGMLVIPKGATAIATVTSAEPKRRMARGGKLSINIDYVRLPNSEKLALRGVQNLKGGGHTGAMTGAMVATAIVAWPAAPFFLFMHGKDVTIAEGQEAIVYTNTDYRIRPLTHEQNLDSAGASKSSGPALTNSDVLKLKSAGLSDELIVQRIKMSPSNYKLSPDDLSDLKKAGLSDAVISAMMTAVSQR